MKILEIKNQDWLKGISAQGNIPVDGLFQTLQGVDPFEQMGVALPSLTPTEVSLGTTPKFLTNVNYGTPKVSYILAHSDTKLYAIQKDSPATTPDDLTSSVKVGASTIGAKMFLGNYVYGVTDNTVNNGIYALVPGGAESTQILTGFQGLSTLTHLPMCIGADKTLYFGNGSDVGQITNIAGTSGNSNNLFSIETGMCIRDLINDGRYLVILADNNSYDITARKVGNYTCRIYFWDMDATRLEASIIYDVPGESYLIGGKMTDRGIEFFGRNGLYVCNVATPPQMIRPFIGLGLTKALPINPDQITFSNGSLSWIDGGTNTLLKHAINAYGNPITGQQKIFYKPYVDSDSDRTQTCLATVGDQVWMGDNKPSIKIHNTGTTRGTVTVSTLDTIMPQPYKYGYTKVVLNQPLSAGQSVTVSAVGAYGSQTLSTNETKIYSASNPRQVLIFKRTPTAGSVETFEDIRVNVTSVGATIQRIAIFATPQDDTNEIL